MVTIKKPGIIPHEKYSGYCHDCGCEFTYDSCDTFTRESGIIGCTDVSHYVKCPTCGHEVHAEEYSDAFTKTFDRGDDDLIY